MGRTSREKPERLGEKLLQVREALGLSQNDLLGRLGLTERLNRDDISKYERGVREPSLLVLLRYARAAGISTDALIDDELDLPAKLPGKSRHRP
ncbi:MAG TPA: helix-turn-helix transcriptional regulator [Pyrinomonadaceae bacterium]